MIDSEYFKKYREYHKEEIDKRMKKYYFDNREKILLKNREYYHNNREKVLTRQNMRRSEINEYWREKYIETWQQLFSIYGDRCSICGESDKIVLSLDHINGDGYKDRKLNSQWSILKRAIKEKDHSKWRILCRNCNWREYMKYKKSRKETSSLTSMQY